ncbi:MAG: septum formation protein Maf [Saprospiraceae bacterium]|nr:septum formation protein Maf [Saprospiraceae bacterium]
MLNTQRNKIVLGSKSPRRSQLLKEAGFEFSIRTQDIDEHFDAEMPVLQVAEDLAIRKGQALKETLQQNEVIITADSVVILDGMIYNKPNDYKEGFDMLKSLSNRTHTVATGISILSSEKSVSFTTITYVTFDILSDDEIDYYLNKFKPYDKAGGYGIQDWIGMCKVVNIEGSYTNVMGLPVRDVYNALRQFFLINMA